MSTTTADRKTIPFGPERAVTSTNALRDVTELTGRVLLATLFLVTGLGKIAGYAATAVRCSS